MSCDRCDGLFSDEPLTLDVLRRELGEPTMGRTTGGCDASWLVSKPIADRWVDWGSGCCWMKGVGHIRSLGQLRRILSVIQETTPGAE